LLLVSPQNFEIVPFRTVEFEGILLL